MSRISYGWFIPTRGDTTAFRNSATEIPPSLDLFVDIARAAENAGFEYILVPVQTTCWDAYISCAMVAARTETISPLVAVRAGLIAPTVMAKMISTFDRLTGGRVRVNLIAGGSSTEMAGDGVFLDHDERYEVMDEMIELMKMSWLEQDAFDYSGKHFKTKGTRVEPKPFQSPYPPFYLGGMSPAAKSVCAKHADVHLFWGDTPENIAVEIADMRRRAAAEGRTIDFGMRLQVIVRETEDEAWAAAWDLIRDAETVKDSVYGRWDQSYANEKVLELAKKPDFMVDENIWSGISSVRAGAGVAVVGDPQQVAKTLQRFIDVGCTTFCLSGYPHAREAERFGKLVMPHLRG